jgi:cathepsin B
MRTLVLLSVLVAVAFCAPHLTQEYVNSINSKQSLWTAGVVPKFADMSLEELKTFCSVKEQKGPSQFPKVSYAGLREFFDLPDNFDIRTKWPNCKLDIRDQGQCGSCWAFGAVESFEDRLCIVTSGGQKAFLSPQALVDCDTQDFGCNGGWPEKAWEYLQANGIPTESCYPYQAYDQPCSQKCADGSAWKTYHAKDVRTYTSLDDVKTDIYTNGPIETWFAVYDDFFSYTSGIYTPTSPYLAGYHAIEVLGWGVQSGVKYWSAANSWGLTWGMKGYFNIQAGTCNFDDIDHFVSGDPAGVYNH